MKYFTPQFYLDFNADDPAIADRADEQWERAVQQYRKHVKRIRSRLPDNVRELAERVDLHDAEYLGYAKVPAPRPSGDVALVTVQRGETTFLLVYVLADEPTFSEPIRNTVFSDEQVHWLYDEVDVVDERVWSHEILLSSGRILMLRFVAFDVLTFRPEGNGLTASVGAVHAAG
jgi:hypothetical protein